jgi:hypothetical protein
MWVIKPIVAAGALALIVTPFLLRPATSTTSNSWDHSHIEASKQTGNAIVKLLDRYRLDRGQFPDHLDDLVSEYISEVPQPVAGEGMWRYCRPQPDFFQLDFACQSGEELYMFLSEFRPSGWQLVRTNEF